MILPNSTISAAVTKDQLYPSPPNTFALQYDPYHPESFPPPIKTLTDTHSKNAPIIIAPHTGYKADILLIVIGVKILKEAEMGISRPQGPRSAPSSPRDGCKNSWRLLSSARIMMDQWARKSVQKLCMLVCQKIIRPRQPWEPKDITPWGLNLSATTGLARLGLMVMVMIEILL